MLVRTQSAVRVLRDGERGRRFHDETDTGELGGPTSAVAARVSYTASYFDKAGRLTDSVDVGTNGGSSYTRPGSVPSRSDTVLVTSYAYNAAGVVETTTDPRGIVGKSYFDALGRTTKTIENYVNGTPSDTDDKTTEFSYDGSGHMLTLKASLTSGYEETKWVYGTNTSTNDDINSNDLLKETRWPDTSTGNASATENDVVTVNSLGETKTLTDRNGSVHTITRDVLGRATIDAVTTLGSGVDGAVRRIETEYDGQGNAYKITSYDAASAGNVVNEVQREFNGLGQMTKEYQEHGGVVNTGTSLNVQYAYSEMSGGANHSRLNTMTYPNGKVLTFNYSTGLNDGISRLSSLSDSTGTLESYDYLGLFTIVKRGHSQPGVDLTFIKQAGESNGDAGDQYIGLDRFDRNADNRWRTSTTDRDRFQYGHDRDGNRLYRDNTLDNNFDELYHANGASNGYDGLNQLTDFRRGVLSDSNSDNIPDTVTTASRTQSWDFDALGNFDSVTTDGTGQTRGHNKQNEITSIQNQTTPTYDSNGNLTRDETGRTFEFDAWNRLIRVKNSGGSTLIEYEYDGANRRIAQTASTTTTDFYYSDQWQVLEERISGNAKIQYIWSPVYVDAMILRDRDADGNGSLEERLWVMHDANFNVTGLYDGNGAVVERYAYDPFGVFTVYDANWNVRGSSNYAWIYLHQGGRWETLSGLYHFRYRDYSPTLGRWVELDPIGFTGGDANLYRYEQNEPPSRSDPTGLHTVNIAEAHKEWINDAFGAVDLRYGAFAWPVNFRLDKPSDNKKGGYIFQHVRITYSIKDNEGKAVRPIERLPATRFSDDVKFDYWEAWRVPKGKTKPAKTDEAKLNGVRASDWFISWGGGDSTNGNIRYDGDVYYADCLDKLPASFKRQNPRTGAGNLRSINSKDEEKLIKDWLMKVITDGPWKHVFEVKWEGVNSRDAVVVEKDPNVK